MALHFWFYAELNIYSWFNFLHFKSQIKNLAVFDKGNELSVLANVLFAIFIVVVRFYLPINILYSFGIAMPLNPFVSPNNIMKLITIPIIKIAYDCVIGLIPKIIFFIFFE